MPESLATWAEYAPGCRLKTIAESLLNELIKGKAPVRLEALLIIVLPAHPLLEAIGVLLLKTVSTGSSKYPDIPNDANDGPLALIKTFKGVFPPMTKPAVSMPPLFTCSRQDILTKRGVLKT